ncbi:hypothetical protein AHF37_04430 [Paragonimus kellicotti]|nr:hypothetical protein AHF37_04430 [Paragonimus kellicotti]
MCMRVNSADSGNSGILFVGFNQDHSCFAVGLQNGFRIFNSDPLKQLERHEFDVRDGTGVGYMDMLFRTNILGILGGGHHARLPSNVACLWDGIKQQFLLEIACASEVCFAVGLQNGFRIFNSDPLKQLERHEFDVRDGTGVGYMDMLFRTNILGILGGGHHARLPSNVACLWDGIKQQFLLEIACASEVKAIRLRRDRVVCFVLSISGCFAVGLQNGFRIFNSDPLKQLERHEFDVRDGTGVGYMDMLFRTNILGILGGGHHARLPSNVACLWDGIKQQFLLEIACASEVKAIRLRRDRIVIVLADAVKVYTFCSRPQLVYESATCANPLGLCHICQAVDAPLIAFPGKRPGSVLLVHVGQLAGSSAACTANASSIAIAGHAYAIFHWVKQYASKANHGP